MASKLDIAKRLIEMILTNMTSKKLTANFFNDGEYGGCLGFTSKGRAVYVCHNHRTFRKESEDVQTMCRLGLGIHEGLHQLLTPMNKYDKRVKEIANDYDIPVSCVHEAFNICEDGFIENQASKFVAGPALLSLDILDSVLIKCAMSADTARSPYEQFVIALNNFEMFGKVLGHFTYEDAAKAFADALPIYMQVIDTCSDKKRMDLMEEIVKITIPLIGIDKEASKQAADQMCDESGHNNSGSSGSGANAKGKQGGTTKKQQAQKDFANKVKEAANKANENANEDNDEESSESAGNGQEGGADTESGNESTQTNVGTESSDTTKKGSKSGSGKSSKTEETSTEKSTSNGKDENGSQDSDKNESLSEKDSTGSDSDTQNEEKSQNSSSGVSNNQGSSNDNGGNANNNDNSSSFMDNLNNSIGDDGDNEGDSSSSSKDSSAEDTLDEAKEWLDNQMKQAERQVNREERESIKSSIDPSIEGQLYRGCGIEQNLVNISANEKSAAAYRTVVNAGRLAIAGFEHRLKSVIDADEAEKCYQQHGKIDLKRLCGSKVTADIFTKETEPKNIGDMSVCILIDNSGSMSSAMSDGKAKIKTAKAISVWLTEGFERVGIKACVMGFDASGDQTPNHYLYRGFNGTKADKHSIMSMWARNGNFDAYSVDYAAQILKKRPEKHKLLVVISDGLPSCGPGSRSQRKADLIKAIDIAKKDGIIVCGVALANQYTDDDVLEQIHAFYRGTYALIEESRTAMKKISHLLYREIRKKAK